MSQTNSGRTKSSLEGGSRVILLMDRLAFKAGPRYYPVLIKKRVHADGRTVYTVEMQIGEYDVIVSDAPTLEEVIKKHEELIHCAFATRSLQRSIPSESEE